MAEKITIVQIAKALPFELKKLSHDWLSPLDLATIWTINKLLLGTDDANLVSDLFVINGVGLTYAPTLHPDFKTNPVLTIATAHAFLGLKTPTANIKTALWYCGRTKRLNRSQREGLKKLLNTIAGTPVYLIPGKYPKIQHDYLLGELTSELETRKMFDGLPDVDKPEEIEDMAADGDAVTIDQINEEQLEAENLDADGEEEDENVSFVLQPRAWETSSNSSGYGPPLTPKTPPKPKTLRERILQQLIEVESDECKDLATTKPWVKTAEEMIKRIITLSSETESSVLYLIPADVVVPICGISMRPSAYLNIATKTLRRQFDFYIERSFLCSMVDRGANRDIFIKGAERNKEKAKKVDPHPSSESNEEIMKELKIIKGTQATIDRNVFEIVTMIKGGEVRQLIARGKAQNSNWPPDTVPAEAAEPSQVRRAPDLTPVAGSQLTKEEEATLLSWGLSRGTEAWECDAAALISDRKA